ncbi:hypothetical protein DHEL01_v206239 [Diaporthe helianthi]|uniref:Uncharacterized protein n=1 Tax=Diaporthe helianthi TaxID=158607 RepID=A0A2P5HYQ5_DIAHE|nr:hypothetical protein DHEL01_v206239 [Diaporthe helianthi]
MRWVAELHSTQDRRGRRQDGRQQNTSKPACRLALLLAHVVQAPGELLRSQCRLSSLCSPGDMAATGKQGQDDLELMQRATRTRPSGAMPLFNCPLPPSAVARPSDYHSAPQASCTGSSALSPGHPRSRAAQAAHATAAQSRRAVLW